MLIAVSHAWARALGTRLPLLVPLRDANFRLYWIGRTVSTAGDQFQLVALAIVALDLTHSASGLGAVIMVQAVPRALLMLFGGVATDRFRARSVMLIADMVQTLLVTALALLAWRGALTLWQLVGYAGLSGIGYAFFLPAANTIVPDLVAREQVRTANALTNTALNLNMFLVPPLAGALVALAGPAPAFGLNAASFLGSVGTLWAVRVAARPPRTASAAAPLAMLKQSLAAARRDAPIWLTLIMAVVYSFGFGGSSLVGVPALAKLDLHAGDIGVGILLGARGVGALLGGLFIGNLKSMPRPGLMGCLAILALSLTLIGGGLAPTLWTAVPFLFLAGAFGGAVGIIFISLIQVRAPEEHRGGIMALTSLAIFGLSPLAYGVAGAIGALLSPRGILVFGGLCIAASGLLGLSQRAMREATG